MPTKRNIESLGSSRSPLMRKRNGPFPALAPEIRVALLAAFYQEKPNPKDLVAWCHTKAEEFECRPEDLSGLVGQLTMFLEREVQILLGNEAEKFAAAAGLTLTRTLKSLNRLINCNRLMTISHGKDFPVEKRWVPDNTSRVRAVETALTYFGKMDQRYSVKHEHEHKHVIMNLSDEEVIAQIRELNRKTQAMLDHADEKPQVVDVEAQTVEART